MGAHRHLKVRADQYFSGILCNRILTIAAVIVSVLLALLIWYLVSQKQSLRRNRLRATWVSLGLTVVLLALLVIPSARAILIYPWLLLCAVMLWLFQLAKMWLVNDHIRKNEQ